jgi:tRNA A58 N-methylase Trm61
LWDKNSDETFRMVTDAIARKELLEEFADEVENLKALITDLDTVPDTWTDTKKAWTENNKKERAYLSEQRNSLSKLVTALKNNDNNADVEKAVRERQNELMKKQHGVLTEQQIQDFVKYRDELSFKSVAKSMDYFPTPPNIVDMLIEKADLKCGQMILEPSAGKGNIAEAIQQKVGDCATLHVVEYSDYNRLTLEAKNYTVVGSDFLNFGVKERNDRGLPIYEDGVLYDRIVMNPPFQDGMDFMHITHAYKMLADDGVLVAIVPSSSYVGLGRDATEKNAFIEANEGTINIIKKQRNTIVRWSLRNWTIDIAIITLRRRNVGTLHIVNDKYG